LFNANAQVRIGAADAIVRENLARYLIRAPFLMNKIRYDTAARILSLLAVGGSSGRTAASAIAPEVPR